MTIALIVYGSYCYSQYHYSAFLVGIGRATYLQGVLACFHPLNELAGSLISRNFGTNQSRGSVIQTYLWYGVCHRSIWGAGIYAILA